MNSFKGFCAIALLTGFLQAAEPTEIVPPGYLKRDLVLLPDGSGAVYAEAISAANLQLRAVKFADKSVSLFQKAGRELSFSADGQVIAFTQGDGLSCQVEVHDRASDNKFSIRAGFVSAPAVSPDGRHVVVVAEFGILHVIDLQEAAIKPGKGKSLQIELRKDPKGNQMEIPGVKRLTPLRVQGDYAPHFSPDGKTIVFASRRDNDFEIYAMAPDGEQLRRLTSSPGIDNQPVFSPDGKRIAFTSNRDLNYEIYVMDADGTNPRRITHHPERDDFACWSADGRSVMYVGERNGRFGIFQSAVP